MASATATTATPAGTAITAVHGPVTATPVHMSGGSSRSGPAPSSTAPRSARHHGSSIAAAAVAASATGTATGSTGRRRASDVRHRGFLDEAVPISVPPPLAAVEPSTAER